MLSFEIYESIKILSGDLVSRWEGDDVLLADDGLLFEMLLDVDGDAFVTKG